MRLVRERVIGRQHAAPRVAVEIEFVQPEVGAQRLELVDEAVGAPERRIIRLVGRAATELVVEDDAPIRARQALQRLQIETAATRPAVQEHERSVAVAEDPVADGSALDLDRSAFFLHVPPQTSGAAQKSRPAMLG